MMEAVRLHYADENAAVHLLTRAFVGDAAWATILADDAVRERALPRLWRAVVGISLAYGEVWTTPDVAGIACFLSSGRASVTPRREMRTGFRFSRLIAGLPAADRRSFLSAALAFDRLRRRAMRDPHTYLWALGVDPDQQRRGLGSSLLASLAARADATGSPIYLETQSARTVEFYRRAGFEVLAEESVLDGRLHVWGMSRQPCGA